MRSLPRVLFVLATIGAEPALAQTEPPQTIETAAPAPDERTFIEADTQTRLWLQLQSSGQIAGSSWKLPGKVATLVYQRYLNSFKYPIPQQFNFKSGGGSGTGSGSTPGR